ncbi:hypothetical protein CUMW_143590 [Citrus unshiu]|uniref:RRM domain-containing protein n=1 Tax=Citrus unshiu TaxID=55188 RepID=A0A2H5PJW9_CITUN|nr:hypothetical protein CUMW_143590 [Citrus unshiu]
MGAKQKKALKKNLKKVSSQLPVPSDKKGAADFLPLEGGPGRKLTEEKPLVNKATVLYIGRIPHGFYEKEMQAFFSQFGAIKRLRIARNKMVTVLSCIFDNFSYTCIIIADINSLIGLMFFQTGQSKHFGFIEFNDPEVAEVVADAMHGYLLFEHILQVHLIPPEHVHPKLNYMDFSFYLGYILWKCLFKSLLPFVWADDYFLPLLFPLICRWRGFNPRYKPVDRVQVERKLQNKERTLEEHKKLVEKILKRDQKRRKRIEAAGIEYECPEIVGNVMPAPKKIKFNEG